MIPDRMEWRKSSYSSSDGDCVEVQVGDESAAVRDSKNPNPKLRFSVEAMRSFVSRVSGW